MLASLAAAVGHAGSDAPGSDAAADAAVDQALRTFEERIEPVLRRNRSAREVLALEVAFAQVRSAVAAGADPGPAVTELGERLRRAIEARAA
ncbi:MAG: hypothetical protein R3F59_23015 [Myxococcota bacterium]